jgi:hypothetical protein
VLRPGVSLAATTWTGGKVSQTDRWDQRHAEEIVAAVTHGRFRSRDVPGAPQGIHDFDVELPDGRVVAVEVMRHNSAGRLQVLAEIQERTWTFPGLASSWHLTLSVDPQAQVGALHAEAEDLLAVAAQAGHDRFQPRQGSRLHQLGVRAVIKLPQVRPPQVICAFTDDFDPAILEPTAGRAVVQAVEQRAARKAQQKAASPQWGEADERHLFLWIEFSQRATLADLGFVGTPQTAPQLPPSIDAVWVAEALCPGRVLLYRCDEGWADHGVWSTGSDNKIQISPGDNYR